MHLNKKKNLLCYYPLDEGTGSTLYDQGYSMLNDLLWSAELSDPRKTTFTSQYIQWKITSSSVIFCDSNENLINGHCVASHEKSLQLARGITSYFTIPILEYQQDLTIEMWCNFNFASTAFPYTEIIWQRPNSISLQLTVTGASSGTLSFYPNSGNTHLDLPLTILSSISGNWVHISYGQSSAINTALLMLINSLTMNVYQVSSTAYVLTPGTLTLNIGSSSDSTNLNACVRELRIWGYYRGLGKRYNEAFTEILPYQYAAQLTGYWKLSEADGNTIKDFSQNCNIALLAPSSTRVSPRWAATMGANLFLCGPNQYYKINSMECSYFNTPLSINVPTNAESLYTLNVGNTNPLAAFTLKVWIKIVSFYGASSQYVIIQKDGHFQINFQYATSGSATIPISIGPNFQNAFTGTPFTVGLWTYFMLTFSNATNTAATFSSSMDATSSFILTATNSGLYTTAGTGNPNIVVRVSNCKVALQSFALTSTLTSAPYVNSALQ